MEQRVLSSIQEIVPRWRTACDGSRRILAKPRRWARLAAAPCSNDFSGPRWWTAVSRRMPQSSQTQRAIALAILAALPLGFAYSGAATVRLYRELFLAPPASGYNASVDGNLALVNLTSGEQLRAAVADARWPPNDDVVVVVASSNLSNTEVMRFYYSAS